MRAILLIMIGASFLLASATVTSSTGLIWQDNSEAKNTKRDWQGAVTYCSELSLAGDSDWRLPSIKELQSIVDVGRYKPAIQKGFKHVNTSGYCWSSSVYVSNKENAWVVNFEYGSASHSHKTVERYVRCVRGRQSL